MTIYLFRVTLLFNKRHQRRKRQKRAGLTMNGDGTVSAGADGVSVARSSGALPGEAFSSAFPMRCRMTPTSKYVFMDGAIVRAPRKASGARGDLETGHWPLRRGFDGQDSGGRAWPSCALCSSYGTGPQSLRHCRICLRVSSSGL